jgi:hypothetical protein
VHSVTQDTIHIPNTENDTLQAFQFADYQQTIRILSGYLRLLDVRLPSPVKGD